MMGEFSLSHSPTGYTKHDAIHAMFRKFYKANITGSWKMVRKICTLQIIPTVWYQNLRQLSFFHGQ